MYSVYVEGEGGGVYAYYMHIFAQSLSCFSMNLSFWPYALNILIPVFVKEYFLVLLQNLCWGLIIINWPHPRVL